MIVIRQKNYIVDDKSSVDDKSTENGCNDHYIIMMMVGMVYYYSGDGEC
jgi:hypothetical protein